MTSHNPDSHSPVACKAFAAMLAAAVLQLVPGAAHAALAAYSFATAANPSGEPGVVNLLGGSAFVAGSFDYDAAAPATGTSGGLTIYGIQNIAPAFPSSFANLVGSVQGNQFSDGRGTTAVGNDNFAQSDLSTNPPTTTFVDFLQLNTQSQTPTVGFAIGAFTLKNVRMFWIEGAQMPNLVPEFLPNQGLPGVLPAFQGRLALDFVATGDPNGPQYYAFFDGLTVSPVAAVPEPDTYAIMLAGLGLLGVIARRRNRSERGVAYGVALRRAKQRESSESSSDPLRNALLRCAHQPA